jgi:tetratricopeptide (TPR) repeat protein
VLTVSHLLGALQEDPDNTKIVSDLREALAIGDPRRTGDSPLRLVQLARDQHESRSEHLAVVGLLEAEVAELERGGTDPDGRAALLVKAGRLQREELLDDEAAKKCLERALALRPGDDSIKESLEQIATAESNWKEIAKRFVDEAETASEPALKCSLLVSAGSLVWKYKKRGREKDTDRVFRQAIEADPGDPRATRLYAHTLTLREKWDDLAAVLLEAAEKTKQKDDRLSFFLQAARVIARKLEQKDRAAAVYDQVVSLSPGHGEGMAYLVEHFMTHERWDHLVQLYDDALRGRLKPEAEQGILLQIGMVHWRFRQAPADAEPYFARLRKLDPVHPGMLGFYRDFLTASGDHAKLLTILTDAQRITQDPKQKASLGVELARAAQSSGASDKAVEAWKAVQRIDPTNAEALPALRELYRQSQKWNALVEILKAEADAITGDGPEVIDAKIEKLREMVGIYRDHLKLDVMAVNTWSAILALRPSDRDALESLAATYEGMGRWNDLIQVLTKKAEATEDAGDQVALYMRVAKLWIDRFANYNQATRPLEIVVEKEPAHREALNLLKEIYTKRRSWKQLFDVLSAEAALASDPDVRQAHRIELARLAADRLHRPVDAIPLWKQVLEADAANKEAIDSLEKLAEREKDWVTLAEVIERRVGAADDDKERTRLLTKLAALYGEQVGDGASAAEAWKRVLRIDPKNGRALRTLRESYVQAQDWDALEALYGETSDWDGLAEVLGNAADKAEDPEQKAALSFRAAEVYEARIGEPQRAFRAYERVLAAIPTNERAARALLPIYEKDEKWSRLPALYDVLLPHTPDQAGKLALLGAAREIASERLKDGALALRYAAEAFQVDPTGAASRATLESTAEKTGSHAAVVQAYESRLASIGSAAEHAEERRWLRGRVASLAAEKLGDVDRAAGALRAVLEESPTDTEATAELDGLLRKAGRHSDLRAHFQRRIDLAGDDAEKWMLLCELARLEETELGDAVAAAALYRRAVEIDPKDRDSLAAIDRLAEQAGRWDEVVSVVERRRGLASDAERGELTLRLGEIHLDRKPDLALARGFLAEALAARPSDARAIAGLERVKEMDPTSAGDVGRLLEPAYEATGSFDKLRAVLEARLSSTSDADEKRALRLRVAELSVGPLGDAQHAYRTLESAFLDTPSDREIGERFAAAAEASGQHEPYAVALATVIEAGELADADVLVLADRAAQVYRNVLGRPAEAEPFDRRVLAIEPTHDAAFNALKELYTDAERWQDLQALYRQRIAQTVDVQSKLDLLLQLCFVFEELIDEPRNAIRVYRDVLELEPRHLTSRRALDRLYTRTEQWRDLAELLRLDVEDGGDADATETLVRIGALHETKLGEPKAAVDAYESALGRSPDHGAAREALERLLPEPTQRQRIAGILEPVYEMREDYAGLVRALEVQLESAEDDEAKVRLLSRIADLASVQLSDWGTAFHAYARAVPLSPDDANLREQLANATRARVAGAADAADQRTAYEARGAVLETSLGKVEAGSSTEREIVSELATLWDDEAQDSARAEPWLERAYTLLADDPEARLRTAQALERIHVAAGASDKLAADLRRQIDLENDPSQKGRLLVRLADLQEESLGDREAAIRTHGERVELDPTDLDALRALERLYTQAQRWAPLLGVLEQLDASATDDAARRGYALRAAELAHRKLADGDRAVTAYGDVLARFGPARDCLEPLVELHEAASRWNDLLEALDQLREIETDGSARAANLFRVAEIRRNKLSELEAAVETYGAVLELEPSHAGATAALVTLTSSDNADVRFAAARMLRPRFEAQGASRDLLGVLDVLSRTEDPTDRLEALRRGAEVADALGDASGAYDRVAAAVRVGSADPDLGYLLGEADRLAAASDKWLEHGALLEDLAPEVGDADLQVETYRRLAVLRRERLEDAAGARATYERILELRADDADAIAQLEALVQTSEDWPALLEVVRRKTDFAQGAERVALLVRQAEICETKLNDVPRAIAALDEVLVEADPPPVYASLERLYAASERWSDLVSLYERMLEKKVGAPVEVRHRLGNTYGQKLNDTEAAIEQYREALSHGAQGAHEPTIEALERLLDSPEHKAAAAAVLEPIYLARLQWKKVQRTLEARLEPEQDLDARKSLLSRLGQLHEDYLEDLDGAFGMYVRMFREDPRDESSWDTLTRLAKVLERWDRLADTYRDTLKEIGVDDAVTYKLATLAGELYESRANRAESAVELYRLAAAYAPTERAPFDALERLLTRSQSWADLLKVYRDRIDVAESDDERLALLNKSAEVERDRNADADRAITIYREMLELDPTHPSATEALESLLVARERWNDLADLLRLRIDHADGSDAEVTLKARLGEVQAKHLRDLDAAIDTYEDVLRSRPDHQPSVSALEALIVEPAHQLRIIRILEPIYSITDQWKKQIAIHEAEAKLTDEPAEQVRLLSEIARLHEDRGRNADAAFSAYARALGIEPGNDEVRGNVDRLAAMLDDWNGLVVCYEAAIARTNDTVVQASLLSTLARVHDEKRGDPRAAIQTFERILAVDPQDPSPLDALEALHTMVGDWRGMVATLEKKVERSYDPVERGETLRRAGSVAEDLLGDPAMAIALYKRAIQEDDTDAIGYESLDRLYAEASDFAQLAPVLSRRLELETDADLRADIALRLGEIAEGHLREPETAIRAYQQALADRPGEAAAVTSLGRLYERQAQWPDFLENLRMQAATAESSQARVALLFRAAEVLERELDDVSEALATHENVLSIDPRHEPSIAALVRISRLEDHREQASQIVLPFLEAQGRWQDVAELEELVVAASSDPFEKQQHLRRLAQIHEEGRGDKAAAFEATRRALAEDASDRSLVDQLERLGGELKVWEQVADTLSARAGGSVDADTGLDLLGRLARIAEGPLADDARAIDAHRRRLQIVSDDETSLAALDRLYTKGSSWSELVDVVERRAQAAASGPPAEHTELLVRLGALRWERFSDTSAAFAAFREVLERDPSEPRALGATEGLLADERLVSEVVEVLDVAYRATGATAKIAGLYDVRIRLADSDGERVRLWIDLAQLRENDLADAAGALDCLIKAYELDPRDEALLSDLERLAGASGRFEALRGLAERVAETTGKDALDSTMKRDLFVRAAGWYRDRLADTESAEKALRAALAADRESPEANEQLVEILREPGRERSLVDALLAWAEVELDEPAKIARLFEAARLAESAMRDAGIARRAFERVLDGDPANAEALDELTRLATSEQRWGDAASLLERRIDVESDPDRRVGQRRRLATVVRDRIQDPKRAIEAWQAVLDEVPTDLESIGALETLFESEKRYRDLEDLVQRRLDIAESEADRTAARVRLARLAELQGRRGEAMEQLRDILADAPNDREALDALEGLYQADGKLDLLAESVASRAEAAAQAGDRTEELRLLGRLAQIQERDLKKPADAAATFERVRVQRPDDTDNLASLARLYKALGRHKDAVEALETIGRSLSGEAAVANALEVADLAEGPLADTAVAETALRRALSIAPGHAAARTKLRALFDKTKNHAGRAELLAEDAEAEGDKAKKLALYKEIADLYAKQLNDAGRAAQYFEKAVALDPEDRNSLLPLCDLYIAAGRSGDAVPVLEKIIASFGTRRSKDVATYHHRLGQALEGMGKTPEALAAYDSAFKIDLTSVPILRDLGRLCYSSGDWDRAQKTFRALLLQKLDATSGITKGDVYFYLGDITAKQGDPKKAISMLDRALVEQPGHPQAAALLAQLKSA